jgi:threonine dehydrogenase-like Zn-dependent dehydrogenase
LKALYFKNNELQLIDTALPEPKENEVLIRPIYSGICNTDLEILKGYMNFQGIMGHEFVGIVEKSPGSEWIGKTVVGEINLACGDCTYCINGLGNHCLKRTILGIQGKDGAMAEYLTLPLQNIHAVPEEVEWRKAVFTEPLAAACEILEQLEILPQYQILLIGDGKLAQLIARVLKLHTENLTVVGKHPSKIELFNKYDIPAESVDHFNAAPASFQVVIEATGNWEGWGLALDMLMPRGFLILKSTYVGNQNFNPAPLVINEITLIGSRCGPFPKALQLLKEGIVDPLDLITNSFSLNEWEKAFQTAIQADSMKVLLEH